MRERRKRMLRFIELRGCFKPILILCPWQEEMTKAPVPVPVLSNQGSPLEPSAPRKPSTPMTGGNKCGGNGTASSPALLKEQLELIHQIIQQAQEESITHSASPAAKPGKGKKTRTPNAVTTALLNSNSATASKFKLEVDEANKGEDKPVECTICCRRFKNTPALNGHMRLHGGYFKGGKVRGFRL
jgi:hypothetical protein